MDDVVRDIEALGFPRQEIRTLEEPKTLEVTGIMSFGRLDFEVDLSRELNRIGASREEALAYVEGLRRGGALAFATGPDEKMTAAADVMSRYGAVDIEQVSGPEPQMPVAAHSNVIPMRDGPIIAGRILQSGGGPRCFVW